MTQEKLPHRKELCLQSESSMSTLRSGPHGKFQKQKGIRICSGLYRSFILYAHDRGTRLYLAVPYRWGGGTGGFGEPGR